VSGAAGTLSDAELRAEVIRLGPWHIDVEITPAVSTAASLDAPPGAYSGSFGKISFSRRRDGIMRRLQRIFPHGMEGRSVMDCACNCGAYLFWSREHGAGECFGFDAREHWIRQARFLARHRTAPSDGMRFEVCDLYDLPRLAPGRFDVTWFNGIFYHLPDPISGLKLAADLTDELLILNTATRAGHADGALVVGHENPDRLLAGMDSLNWFPTGPRVLTRILNWMGFPEVRCSVWRSPPGQPDGLDRIEMLAARRKGYLADFDASAGTGAERLAHVLGTTVAPGAGIGVLTAAGEDAPDVRGRRVVSLAPAADDEAVAQASRLAQDGIRYLAAGPRALATLADRPRLTAWIRSHQTVASAAGEYELFDLEQPVEGGGVVGK
jgi:tRNA (mo5U34)-methyltransferase